MTPGEVVAANIIKKHGVDALERLLDGLRANRPLAELARELGVSRERARQWAEVLGYKVTAWQPDPGCARLSMGYRWRE